jgi:hypothetical protein
MQQSKPYQKTILLAGLAIVGVWLIIGLRGNVRTIAFTIPAGYSTGQAAVDFPDEIVLTLGVKDTLVINNQDDVIHTFGPFVVGPQTTFTKQFTTPRVYQGACSFHQNRQMKLVINPAPWDFWSQ